MKNSNKKQSRELPIPPSAEASAEAYEILRIWLARAGPQFALLPNVWTDPAGWGLLLVDVARHVAQGMSGGSVESATAHLDRIRNGFDAEWERMTTDISGGFLVDEE